MDDKCSPGSMHSMNLTSFDGQVYLKGLDRVVNQ